MKIAVFSDTHGLTRPMIAVVRSCCPDAVIHLGDHDRDAAELLREFPGIALFNVCGNCDYSPLAPLSRTVQLGPVKAFLTHGHQYSVHYGNVDRLVYAAQEAGAKLVLFGHTHIPYHEDIGGVKVVNPGTSGKGRELTWVLLTIYENGGIAVDFKMLER